MHWCNVYKTSLNPEGGLLTSSYYVEQTFAGWKDFYLFAPYLFKFDRAWNGSQTQTLCVTARPANSGDKTGGSQAFVWTPTQDSAFGMRPVINPLPWRWCLDVGHYAKRGRPHHHWYHDSIDHSEATYGLKGSVVLKVSDRFRDEQTERLTEAASSYRDWLRLGYGSAQPGSALWYEPCREAFISGLSIHNKGRRHQALLFKQAVTFQAQLVAQLSLAGVMVERLYQHMESDTGNWLTPEIRRTTTTLMGTAIAMAQAHKENNKGENDLEVNDGAGWNVRYGPTGANLAALLDRLQQQQQADQKYLQQFPISEDVRGDEYFTNENGRQWMKIAAEWVERVGQFGGFDFFSLDQKGLKDNSRVDNYTPLYPDLKTRVDGLPKPEKNPEHSQRIPGLFL